ncbi:MAG: aquaporin [Xanthobacteraceae bacterium]
MKYINDNRLRAEFFGTLVLVLIGCSSIVLTGLGGAFPMAALPIGLAFGLAYTAMVYTIGPVSGCHINPAVTAAFWSAGRISGADAIAYVVAQFIGAFVGALLLVIIVKGKAGGYHVADSGLGATTWGTFGVWPAIIAEFIGTTIFTLVMLATTGSKGPGALAGLIIGLTLLILHLAFFSVSGTSVNPARSFGPALFVGGKAFGQVWMYLIVPTLGGLFAGWLIKSKRLDV